MQLRPLAFSNQTRKVKMSCGEGNQCCCIQQKGSLGQILPQFPQRESGVTALDSREGC